MVGAEDDDVVVPNNRNTCSGEIGRFLLLLVILRRDDDTLIADELMAAPLQIHRNQLSNCHPFSVCPNRHVLINFPNMERKLTNFVVDNNAANVVVQRLYMMFPVVNNSDRR